MRLTEAVLLPTILVGTAVLTACGSNEPPKCSDAIVEKTVTAIFLKPLDGTSDFGSNWTGHPAKIDGERFKTGYSFKYTDHRQRRYDENAKKRYCTATVKASFDSSKVLDAITLTANYKPDVDDDAKGKIKAEIAKWKNGVVRFNTEQNYSVQYTEQGQVYVVINE